MKGRYGNGRLHWDAVGRNINFKSWINVCLPGRARGYREGGNKALDKDETKDGVGVAYGDGDYWNPGNRVSSETIRREERQEKKDEKERERESKELSYVSRVPTSRGGLYETIETGELTLGWLSAVNGRLSSGYITGDFRASANTNTMIEMWPCLRTVGSPRAASLWLVWAYIFRPVCYIYINNNASYN